jgi:hypothetical protein
MTSDPTAQVRARLQQIQRDGIVGAEKGLDLATEHLLGEARDEVPIEEGTLGRSGKTSRDGLTGAVSFNTPYAVVQHEDMTLTHDPGRRAKYLERPMNTGRDTFGQIIATSVRREIGA